MGLVAANTKEDRPNAGAPTAIWQQFWMVWKLTTVHLRWLATVFQRSCLQSGILDNGNGKDPVGQAGRL